VVKGGEEVLREICVEWSPPHPFLHSFLFSFFSLLDGIWILRRARDLFTFALCPLPTISEMKMDNASPDYDSDQSFSAVQQSPDPVDDLEEKSDLLWENLKQLKLRLKYERLYGPSRKEGILKAPSPDTNVNFVSLSEACVADMIGNFCSHTIFTKYGFRNCFNFSSLVYLIIEF